MEVRWLGESTFEIKSAVGTVICDPSESVLADFSSQDPNVVFAFSRPPARWPEETATLKIVRGPGEYEIGGLSLKGVATPAEAAASSRQINTAYVIDADGVYVCALGGPGVTPDSQSVQLVGHVDILLVSPDSPLLGADDLSTTVRNLEPGVVVPSGYDSQAGAPGPALARLLEELGVKDYEPQPRLSMSRSGIPEERTVVVLSRQS